MPIHSLTLQNNVTVSDLSRQPVRVAALVAPLLQPAVGLQQAVTLIKHRFEQS